MLRENDLLKTIDGETLLNSPLNSPAKDRKVVACALDVSANCKR